MRQEQVLQWLHACLGDEDILPLKEEAAREITDPKALEALRGGSRRAMLEVLLTRHGLAGVGRGVLSRTVACPPDHDLVELGLALWRESEGADLDRLHTILWHHRNEVTPLAPARVAFLREVALRSDIPTIRIAHLLEGMRSQELDDDAREIAQQLLLDGILPREAVEAAQRLGMH